MKKPRDTKDEISNKSTIALLNSTKNSLDITGPKKHFSIRYIFKNQNSPNRSLAAT